MSDSYHKFNCRANRHDFINCTIDELMSSVGMREEPKAEMEVIVRKVKSDDWEALYINNNKVDEGHRIEIKDVCDALEYLIESRGVTIHKIIGENYYLNEEYIEDNGFPLGFDEIPENMFE